MKKINNPSDLINLRKTLQEKLNQSMAETSDTQPVRIHVAMATCSIASGSREIMNYLADELEKRNIHAEVKQTGCMGYCYAEPTVEVRLPFSDPVVFGYVDIQKADDIIEKYIKAGIPVDGIIPVNHQKISQTL